METLCELGAKLEKTSKESQLKMEISLMALESIYNRVKLFHVNPPNQVMEIQGSPENVHNEAEFIFADQELDDYQISQIKNVPFLFHKNF